MLNEILQGRRLERYVPFVGWITSYQRVWLRDDVVSGIVVGLIMIPVAMAYAQMAVCHRRRACIRPSSHQARYVGCFRRQMDRTTISFIAQNSST